MFDVCVSPKCVCVYAVYALCCAVGYRGCCQSAQMVGVFFIYLFIFFWERGVEEMRRGGGRSRGKGKGELRQGEEGCVSDAAMPRSRGQQ